jgi:hypothetical protein
MRPLVNVAELKAGNIIGDCKEEGEREIGDGSVNVVCRYCWLELLGSKTKDEIIEIFETICGLLFEIDRRYKEEKKQALQVGGGSVGFEWATDPNIYTIPSGGTIWKTTDDSTITITGTSSDHLYTTGNSNTITFDTTNTSMSSGTLFNLGNQWEGLTSNDADDANGVDDANTEEE